MDYLRRLLFLRALGVTLTVIVTGTVTLRVVRVGLFFFFVAIGIEIFIGYPFRAFIQDNSPFILFNSDCNWAISTAFLLVLLDKVIELIKFAAITPPIPARGFIYHFCLVFHAQTTPAINPIAWNVSILLPTGATSFLSSLSLVTISAFRASNCSFFIVVKIVLQGSWIYRVLPCMLFCSYSYFCLAFW